MNSGLAQIVVVLRILSEVGLATAVSAAFMAQ